MQPTPALVPFPTLAVKVQHLKRLLSCGAPSGRVREQLQSIRLEHRRRLDGALRTLRTLKPRCTHDMEPMWQDTLDSAILLLHLNARDFKEALHDLSGTRRCGRG